MKKLAEKEYRKIVLAGGGILSRESGFTLVELMIAMAMSGIVVAAVYAAYLVQQKSYHTQDQVIEMQQNIRAAMEIMTSEIRMATYDPGGNAGASITTATATTLAFTSDLNDNGVFVTGGVPEPGETISYGFGDSNNDGTNDDSNNDGIVDADDDGDGVVDKVPFRRSDGGGVLQPIAENIGAVEFHYILEDETEVANPTAAQRDRIQAVRVSLLAVAEQRTPNYTNSQTYPRGSGQVWGPFNDGFHRRAMTTTVYIRNRGLVN